MRHAIPTAFAVAAAAATLATTVVAQEPATTLTLTLKDHRFTPDALVVPAGRKVRILLVNQDPALEEFDSDDLGVEEDVTPNGRTSFSIGPLKPGVYSFMGEFHAGTAKGRVIAGAGDGAPGERP